MENLSLVANAANHALKGEPGFIRCDVPAENPNTLRYLFDSPENAEKYKFKRQLQGVQYPMQVVGSNLIEARE